MVREFTFRRSAAISLSATSLGVPKSLSDEMRTGFTTTPMVLPRFVGSSNKTVAPAFSTYTKVSAIKVLTFTSCAFMARTHYPVVSFCL